MDEQRKFDDADDNLVFLFFFLEAGRPDKMPPRQKHLCGSVTFTETYSSLQEQAHKPCTAQNARASTFRQGLPMWNDWFKFDNFCIFWTDSLCREKA